MRGYKGFLFPLIAALYLVLVACGPAAPTEPVQNVLPSGSRQSPSTQTDAIPSSEASSQVGNRATVCGPVVDARYATKSKGQPTFLNFDKPYPNHTFVVLIWGSDRRNFPDNPERHYKGQDVCATGLIENYKGKAEIIARDSSQLEIRR